MLSGSTRLHQSLTQRCNEEVSLTVLNSWFNDHALLSRPTEVKLQPIVTLGLPSSRKSQGKTKIFQGQGKVREFCKRSGKILEVCKSQ